MFATVLGNPGKQRQLFLIPVFIQRANENIRNIKTEYET